MRTPHQTRAPRLPPWSVSESADQQEERDARIDEMMQRAQKHQVKATSRNPEVERIAELLRMFDNLCRDYLAEESPERAGHLADAMLDLNTLIVRAKLQVSTAEVSATRSVTDKSV